MTPAKEIDGELWVKASDAHRMADLAHEAGKAIGAGALREEIAQLVERMGMQGFGTLAIAAAIRQGKS